MDGWIKLDRAVLESRYFQNPNDLKIWLWLMLKASTLDRFVSLKIGKGCQTLEVKRGQLIFGRHKAEQDLKIDGSTIYRTLQRFQDDKSIKIEANNQFSLITVLDFIESQSFAEEEIFEISEVEQPMSNQRTSNEQATNNQRTGNEQATNTVIESLKGEESKDGLEFQKSKEGTPAPGDLFGEVVVNNKKGKRKKEPGANILPHLFKDSDIFDIAIFSEKLQGTNYEGANLEYYHESANNWSQSGNNKKIDWLATVKNWMSRDMTAGKFITKDFKNQNVINGKQGINGNDHQKSRNVAPGVTVQGYAASLNERFGGEGQ